MEVRSEVRRIAPVAVAMSPSFGAMLKRYRRAASLTQEALAERAGYSVGHISKLESSVRQPVPATVELLADALELGPHERRAFGRAARRTDTSPYVLPPARARSTPPVIGRTQEEASIERHLDGSAAEPPLLLFSGEPGIGKSRLLELAYERGTSDGWFVLEGTCRRHGASGSYAPLLEALASAIRRVDPPQLRSALEGCSWLVRLLPELAETRGLPMPAWSLPADQERRLMFSAVERFLRNIAGPAGTLLVLDNLHWVGSDALDMLTALISAQSRSPLRIIGAFRHTEVRPEDRLASLVADLAHDGLVTHETLGPLAPGAAAALLTGLLADVEHVDEQTRAEVLHKAAGVPFVLVSYAQWLRSDASQKASHAGRDSAALEIPWDVKQTIQGRVTALPAAAQAVVQIAAVSDGEDTRELLTTVAGQLGYCAQQVLEAIDVACEAGLLVARGDDTYDFAYDLTREVVERSLGAAQRAYLHREIAAALEDERAPSLVAAMADHYLQGEELEKAIFYLKRAGAHASALHAYADAERDYRALAERLDSRGVSQEAALAHERLGTMLGFMGRYDEALAELERALAEYRTVGWQDGRARAASRLGKVYCAQGDVPRGIARLERELANTGGASGPSRAMLLLSLAELYHAGSMYGRELDSAEHAARLAYSSNDRYLLALAEMERGTALDLLGRPDQSLRVLEHTAVPLAEATGNLWTQAQALDRAAYGHIMRGEFHDADRDIKHGMVIGLYLEDQLVSAMMTLDRGIWGFYTGAWRQAQADLRWASAMLPRGVSQLSRAGHAAVWLGRLALAQGHAERAEYALSQAVALANQGSDLQPALMAECARAEQDLVAGKPDEARLRLEKLLAAAEYRSSDVTEVLTLLGWAHLELGDERQGEGLVAASMIRASATGLRCALTDALRIRALGVAYAGQSEEALAGVTEALSLARSVAYPYAEAKALWILGRLLLQYGDVEGGGERLAAARAILRQLGEHMYTQLVDQQHLAVVLPEDVSHL